MCVNCRKYALKYLALMIEITNTACRAGGDALGDDPDPAKTQTYEDLERLIPLALPVIPEEGGERSDPATLPELAGWLSLLPADRIREMQHELRMLSIATGDIAGGLYTTLVSRAEQGDEESQLMVNSLAEGESTALRRSAGQPTIVLHQAPPKRRPSRGSLN